MLFISAVQAGYDLTVIFISLYVFEGQFPKQEK